MLASSIALFLVFGRSPTKVESFSLDGQASTRRKMLSLVGTVPSLLLLDEARATCLTGDEAADCIGVYKEHLPPSTSDADGAATVTQSYDLFRPNRPPVVLANPQSLDEAVGMLRDQRLALEDIERSIVANEIEEAGLGVLRVLPRLTLAGRYVVAALQARMPKTQLQQMADELRALALAADNHIGKALHGDMGSITLAQLALLYDVKAMKVSLDRFLEVATS